MAVYFQKNNITTREQREEYFDKKREERNNSPETAEIIRKRDERLVIENKDVVAERNLHIGNSGICFTVLNSEYGPAIKIHTSSFGNIPMDLVAYTDRESLRELGEMFLKCSEIEFDNEEYCYVAKSWKRHYGESSSNSQCKPVNSIKD